MPRLTDPRPGEKIGDDFEVIKALHGGMGQVLLCYCRSKDYFYALKGLNSDSFQKYCKNPVQLRQEVETWIGLGDHPNIVRCYTIQTVDSMPFVFAEWVGDDGELADRYRAYHVGEPWLWDWYARLGDRGAAVRRAGRAVPFAPYRADLTAWMQHGILARNQRLALEVALDICGGLIQISRIFPGTAHGDLKPPNILLTPQGTAKIADFGVSRAFDSQQEPRGSPLHRAPEQWLKAPFDARADIYALGVLLFAMLSGHEPFDSDHRNELCRLHLSAPIPPLSAALQGAGALNEIIHGCLAKAPEDRFATPEELYGALAGVYAALYGVVKLPPHWREPSSIEEKNQVGVARTWLGQLDEAEQLLCAAVQADSSRPETYINRGITRFAAGRHTDALKDFDQALRLSSGVARTPESTNDLQAKAHLNSALVFHARGRYARSLEELDEAGGDPEGRLTRAAVLSTLGRYGDAIEQCTRALEDLPGLAAAHYNRGIALACLGQNEQARAEFTLAEPLFPMPHAATWGDAASLRLQSKPAPPRPSLTYGRGTLELMLGSELRGAFVRQHYYLAHDRDLPLLGFRIREAEYADELHPSVIERASSGERIAQVRLVGDIAYLTGGSAEQERGFIYTAIRTPLPQDIGRGSWHTGDLPDDRPPKEFCIILDEWTHRILQGSGIASLADLCDREVQLEYVRPDDRTYPLHLYSIVG
ncbi:MAG: serine/threonine-protein kinase [Caldilineaceae bacterium]